MEVNDWTAGEKESFTTPGGPFRRPTGEGRTYEYARAKAGQPDVPVKPAPLMPEGQASSDSAPVSPFARSAPARAWYEGVEAAEESPSAVVLSHDGETVQAVLNAGDNVPGTGPVYTIQLPPTSPRAAPKRSSLWWVPLLLIAALLLGLLLGVMAAPLLEEHTSPTVQPTAPAASQPDAGRIYRENYDTVVAITAVPAANVLSGGIQSSIGTGFLISADGFILTNAHVVQNADELLVELSDGRQYDARLVAIETTASDLALLKIEAEGLHPAAIGDSDTVQVGDWIMTIGNPLGDLTYSLTAGYISAGLRQVDTGNGKLTMLQTNAAINKGNSGGPLFNAEGRVIGIVTAKLAPGDPNSTVEGLGFALPINAVMELVQQWLNAEKQG